MSNWNIDETPYPGPHKESEVVGYLKKNDGTLHPISAIRFGPTDIEIDDNAVIARNGEELTITWTHTIQ